MTYREWSHIPIPGITTEPQSPAMRLDYRRFSSDSWVNFLKLQNEIVRRNSPNRWITHNFMIRHWSLDYWKLAEEVDFVSYDNYPHGLRGPAETAMKLDLMHSLKQQNFWTMEQQPGPVNWHPYNPPVPPGQVRQWSHQAILRKADDITHWRKWVAQGGQLIITFRASVREESNISTELPLPGGLTELVGLKSITSSPFRLTPT
jgi:beta-galactosidase